MADSLGTRCKKCGLFSKSSGPILLGSGDKRADVVFVGEAPGKNEDRRREFFVGRAGRKLRYWLKNVAGDSSWYLTNVLRCRPPFNATPKKNQIKCCLPNLVRELEIIRPLVIVALGKIAMAALTKHSKITEKRGRLLPYKHGNLQARGWESLIKGGGAGDLDLRSDELWHPIVIPTFHPAFVLRSPGYEDRVVDDIKRAFFLASIPERGKVKYKFLSDVDNAAAFLDRLNRETREVVYLDLETSSTSPWDPNAKILMASFSTKEREATVIPFYHRESPIRPEDVRRYIEPRFIRFLQDNNVKKGGHNIVAFDALYCQVLYRIQVEGIQMDSLVASSILRQERGVHGLKEIVWEETGMGGYDYELNLFFAAADEKKWQFDNVPIKTLWWYSASDADAHCRVGNSFQRQLKEKDLLWMYDKLSLPAAKGLARATQNGLLIDGSYAKKLVKVYDDIIERSEKNILQDKRVVRFCGAKKEVNKDFKGLNIGSPKQLHDFFFAFLGLKVPTKLDFKGNEVKLLTDKGGMAKLDITALAKMLEYAPQVKDIIVSLLAYRRAKKWRSTYVVPWVKFASTDGRVHPVFLIHGTPTGRIASVDPNAQNFPKGARQISKQVEETFSKILAMPEWSGLNMNIQDVIVAPPDHYIVQFDYSQIELRILAILSGDEGLLQAFESGRDIHAEVASEFYGVPFNEVTPEQRRNAKTINFGLVYGMSALTTAERIGKSLDEASGLMDKYFKSFPKVKLYQEKCRRHVRRTGYAPPTLFDTSRILRDIKSESRAVRAEAERQAGNTPIQGTAAQLTLYSGVALLCGYVERYGLRAYLVNEIHDSVVFYTHKDDLEKVCTLGKLIMERLPGLPFELSVPIQVDVSYGKKFGSLKPFSEVER